MEHDINKLIADLMDDSWEIRTKAARKLAVNKIGEDPRVIEPLITILHAIIRASAAIALNNS